MPIGFTDERPCNLSPWISKYRAEYLAKGCSLRKAQELAGVKARKKWREGKIKP